MLFRRAEVDCWGSGAKGDRRARARVSMIVPGDIEAEEAGQKVGLGGAGPWVVVSPSSG